MRVSAGPGAIVSEEQGRPYFGFDERWLKALTGDAGRQNCRSSASKAIRCRRRSIAGDDILVDLGDAADRLRDGIYVLRVDDAVVVKRIALHPIGRRVTVQSDNPAYPDWPDCGIDEIDCIGRVIWAGRKIV